MVTNTLCKQGHLIKLVSFMVNRCFEPFQCIQFCCKQKKAHYVGEEKKSEARVCVKIPTEVGKYVNKNILLFSSCFMLNFFHCPGVFGTTRGDAMLGVSVFYSWRVGPWNAMQNFSSKYWWSRKITWMCQSHSVQKCCIKCHRDWSRNLSCKILTFGFSPGKLQQFCFLVLLPSMNGSSIQPGS